MEKAFPIYPRIVRMVLPTLLLLAASNTNAQDDCDSNRAGQCTCNYPPGKAIPLTRKMAQRNHQEELDTATCIPNFEFYIPYHTCTFSDGNGDCSIGSLLPFLDRILMPTFPSLSSMVHIGAGAFSGVKAGKIDLSNSRDLESIGGSAFYFFFGELRMVGVFPALTIVGGSSSGLASARQGLTFFEAENKKNHMEIQCSSPSGLTFTSASGGDPGRHFGGSRGHEWQGIHNTAGEYCSCAESCSPTTTTFTATTTTIYNPQLCNGVQEVAGCGTRMPASDCFAGGDYQAFAEKHCPAMCGLQCSSTTTTVTSTTTTVTGTTTTATAVSSTTSTTTTTTTATSTIHALVTEIALLQQQVQAAQACCDAADGVTGAETENSGSGDDGSKESAVEPSDPGLGGGAIAGIAVGVGVVGAVLGAVATAYLLSRNVAPTNGADSARTVSAVDNPLYVAGELTILSDPSQLTTL